MRCTLLLGAVLLLPLLVPSVEAAPAAPSWLHAARGPQDALLVLAPGADAAPAARVAEAAGAAVTDRFDFAGILAVRGSPAALARALAALPGASLHPDEPLTPALARTRAIVNADVTPGGPLPGVENGANVTIAVVDSGVDASHPGFEGRVAAAVKILKDGGTTRGGADADGHGTHVAGIAAGSGAGSRDARLRGVAPGARVAILDISDAFTTTNAVRAFRWIHDHADEHDIRVVTSSWGREKAENEWDPSDPVVRASNALVADGLVVVFSAGNRGEDGRATLTVEATNPNVLAVGAVDARGRPEGYSSRGPARDEDGSDASWTKPDLVAPGTGVVSARTSAKAPSRATGDEERWYVTMNGTSMAAPHVAGAAALLLSRSPSLSPASAMAILRETARDVGEPGPDTDTGWGMLDVSAALLALEAGSGSVVTILKKVPVRATGSLTGALGTVLLDGKAPRAPPAERAIVPVHFATGATRARLHLNWSGPADLAAWLVSPTGERLAFGERSEGSLLFEGPIAPGAWTLEVQPRGAAVATTFTLAGDADVLETRTLEGSSLPFEKRSFLAPPGGFLDSTPGSAFVEMARPYVGSAVGALKIGGVIALLVVSSVLVVRRSRKGP